MTAKSAAPTVAEIIAQALKRHGITVVFSQSLPTAVALAVEDLGIRQFTYRTENAGGAMADGFARGCPTRSRSCSPRTVRPPPAGRRRWPRR